MMPSTAFATDTFAVVSNQGQSALEAAKTETAQVAEDSAMVESASNKTVDEKPSAGTNEQAVDKAETVQSTTSDAAGASGAASATSVANTPAEPTASASTSSTVSVASATNAPVEPASSVESVQDTPALTTQESTLSAASEAVTNMYRLYNPNSGEHFYTSSLDEATSVATAGWRWEGVGWVAPVGSNVPVFRLYNPNAGDHHYTTAEGERDILVSLGWQYEGIGWYSDAVENGRPVLRQYNPNAIAGAHNFTTNVAEDNNLASVGWSREGTAWYASLFSAPAIQGRWLVTSAWGSLGRYWIDSTGAIAVSRMIDAAAEGSGYYAYATETGDVVRGKYSTGNGYTYVADGDGRLASTDNGLSGWIVTAAYDGGFQRYWYDAFKHAMTVGFFAVGAANYYGIPEEGYVSRGKEPWGKYVLLSNNDGVLRTDTGWLETAEYDGSMQRYYLELCSGNVSGAKTGVFTVNGVSYYGISDEGYVGRSQSAVWTNGWWYQSDDTGVLVEIAAGMRDRVNRFVQLITAMAADDSHGYDQEMRWGERGDYDCSSLVISCLKQAGFETGGVSYTGNMRTQLVAAGWEWHASVSQSDLYAGVVLLNEGRHTAAMISSTELAHASLNENGGTVGGQPGDQTGREICIRNYYDYPWDGVLIPTPWAALA